MPAVSCTHAFVGLIFLGRLTSELSEGLTIFVPTTTIVYVVSLIGPDVSLALQAELVDFCLLRDSNR